MEAYFGYTSLAGILITIASIGLSWWALQSFRFDLFLKDPKGSQGVALQIILSMVIGHQLSQFFLDYLGWSFQVRNLF